LTNLILLDYVRRWEIDTLMAREAGEVEAFCKRALSFGGK